MNEELQNETEELTGEEIEVEETDTEDVDDDYENDDDIPAADDDYDDDGDGDGDGDDDGDDDIDVTYSDGPAVFARAQQSSRGGGGRGGGGRGGGGRGGRGGRYNLRSMAAEVKFGDVDFKRVQLLSRFVDRHGRILSRRKTRISAKMQRKVTREIKRARHLALMPYTREHVRITRKRSS